MSSYMVRGIDAEVIRRAKAKAKEHNTHIDAVLIRFLETYAEHGHPQSVGGKTAMGNRTPEERSELGKQAAAKRWEGHVKPTDRKGS